MTRGGGGGTERDGAAEIRTGTAADAPFAAHLHAAAISDGFLATLGPRFLTLLYRRITRAGGAELLVAVDGEGVIGFVAVADDTRAFYRGFLAHDALVALWVAAPSVIRSPRRVWETLRYGASDDGSIPRAEILSVAVDPASRMGGVGTALVGTALDRLRARGVTEAKVVTAANNAAAQRMYEAVGFITAGTTEVHPGTSQQVLLWR